MVVSCVRRRREIGGCGLGSGGCFCLFGEQAGGLFLVPWYLITCTLDVLWIFVSGATNTKQQIIRPSFDFPAFLLPIALQNWIPIFLHVISELRAETRPSFRYEKVGKRVTTYFSEVQNYTLQTDFTPQNKPPPTEPA